MSISRRRFVQSSLLAAGSLGVPLRSAASVRGANEEVRVGVVGLGVRGAGTHVPRWEAQAGVRVVAVCDPDRERLDKCAKGIEEKYGHKVDKYADVRKMLESKEIDVASIATMQYWHSLCTIWACQAGKQVYCEKPLSHYIWEGRQMVAAARKYNRLVQVGTQSRSMQSCTEIIPWLQAGNLGKIKYVTAFANKPRTSIGKRDKPLPIPETVDYELWCGPARKEPIYRDRLQYDCSFTWNMGDGESCNQGVHEMDIARWLLGETGLPRRVMSVGGRFAFNDAGDVPNTQIIYYDFATAPVLYEVHNMTSGKGSKTMPKFLGATTDVCAHCEGGYAIIRGGTVFDNQGKKIKEFGKKETHFENFIAAVRSGKREDLHAEVAQGHVSTAITHVGNVSYRLGQPASQHEIHRATEEIPIWDEMFSRLVTHLRAHEIDVDAKTITLGPWLQIDRERECFKDNDVANRLVRGFYREPFTVPELTA